MHGLADLRVVDCSTGIAGGYCSKLFADAGADVIKVEPPDGDPLRRWSATGADLNGRDGALFRFLHTSKRSVVGNLDEPEVMELVASADVLLESYPAGRLEQLGLCERFPGLVVVSMTAFGRGGPFTDRPATEFTIQAESGSALRRGLPDMVPYYAAGRITEYIGATFAATAALAAVRRSCATGIGEHIDVSLMEAMNIAATMYSDVMYRLAGSPEITTPARSVELPSIEPTLDGWVGVNTNSRQQFNDFCVLIERPELADDPELATAVGRKRRMDEWNKAVREFTTRHTTDEIVQRGTLLRIPIAPVNDGRGALQHEHLRARGVFVRNPDGDFEQPRPAYLVNGSSPALRAPAPGLGEHTGTVEGREPARPRTPVRGAASPPLAGLRILDCTAWWAGPSSTAILASLGADVIHVESAQRPDGMRMAAAISHRHDAWWEYSPIYLAANVNKRGLALDLGDPDGLRLMHRLVQQSDVVVENFSPRVFDQFGLGWKALHELAPRTILVRMPAFGLDGPWRDNVGFAQTMEQVTGLAWITGHPDDQPRIPQGPCDPLAGMHAAFAALVALAERDHTGTGCLVEVPMVEGALNAAAEQIVEYSAYGRTMYREGNRSPWAAPQGLYPCRGVEQWLAVSCETDVQWDALRQALGDPDWARDPRLASHAGRRAAHDLLDEQLAAWASDQDLEAAVEQLVWAGVPAAAARDPRLMDDHPQHVARRFLEPIDHPVVGGYAPPRPPFRFASVDRWISMPAPTLGQHNRDILAAIGVDDDEYADLEARGVIGTRPRGV